jgi:hypothetical protein
MTSLPDRPRDIPFELDIHFRQRGMHADGFGERIRVWNGSLTGGETDGNRKPGLGRRSATGNFGQHGAQDHDLSVFYPRTTVWVSIQIGSEVKREADRATSLSDQDTLWTVPFERSAESLSFYHGSGKNLVVDRAVQIGESEIWGREHPV